jgi:hypothetical protein
VNGRSHKCFECIDVLHYVSFQNHESSAKVHDIHLLFSHLASTTTSQFAHFTTMATQAYANARTTGNSPEFNNPEQPETFTSIADATAYLEALQSWRKTRYAGIDLKAIRVPKNGNLSDEIVSRFLKCLRGGIQAYDAKWRLFHQAVRIGQITDPGHTLVKELLLKFGWKCSGDNNKSD